MAHQVVLIPPRRSTVAPFLQPSLSASSAVRPRLISMTFSSPSPGTRLASTRTTQLASMPSTIICSRSASCLRLHAYRRTHPPEAAIREAHRSPRPGSRAAPAQAVEPAIPTPAAPTPQQRPAVPERQLPATPAVGPLSSESTVPMLRRLWRCPTPAQTVLLCLCCPTSRILRRLRRRCGALFIRRGIQIVCSGAACTASLVLAGPRPAAESAHNKTLQSQALRAGVSDRLAVKRTGWSS